MTVTCLAFSGVIAEDGLDTFGAHHGTASRPSFSRWTRVTFATQMWAAV